METKVINLMKKERNSFIDVLKGIMILFVIVLHSSIGDNITDSVWYVYTVAMAVPVFMVISGYTNGLSYQRKGIDNIEKAYGEKELLSKIMVYVVPYTITFIVEWILFRTLQIYQVDLLQYGLFAASMNYLRGTDGMGSYYFPLLIQMIFVFPPIFFVVKRKKMKGLLLCVVCNISFEIIKTAYGLGEITYRLLIFRYLALIGLGCYLAMHEWSNSLPLNGSLFVVGITAQYVLRYTRYEPKILNMWPATSFLACFWIYPVMAILIQRVHFHFKPLELIGRASYHIFLVQMVYFCVSYRLTEGYGELQALGMNLGICVAIGLLFYILTNGIVVQLKRMIIER